MWLKKVCPVSSEYATKDIVFSLPMGRTVEIETVRERNHCKKHQNGYQPFLIMFEFPLLCVGRNPTALTSPTHCA